MSSISKVTLDISTFDDYLKEIYRHLSVAYVYSEGAKLAKGELYKFLTSIGVTEKSHKEVANKIFRADCMNTRSILGIKVNEQAEEPEEGEEDEEPEEEDEDDEEEELPKLKGRSLSKRIKSRRIRGASLTQAFLLNRYCIRMLMEYTQEDIDEMKVADIRTLVEVLRLVYTSMYRVAEKYFPGKDFRVLPL